MRGMRDLTPCPPPWGEGSLTTGLLEPDEGFLGLGLTGVIKSNRGLDVGKAHFQLSGKGRRSYSLM